MWWRSMRRYGAIPIRRKWRIRLFSWLAIWCAALRGIRFLWMLDFTSWVSENDSNPAAYFSVRRNLWRHRQECPCYQGRGVSLFSAAVGYFDRRLLTFPRGSRQFHLRENA